MSASVIGLVELDQHLDSLLSPSPTVDLTPDLFEDVKLRVTEDNAGTVAAAVMGKLVALLKSPAILGGQGALVNTDAVCSLATKLLSQPVYSFTDALTIAPTASLVEALRPDATPATNKLAIAVIDKAVGPRTSASWAPSATEAQNMAVLSHGQVELFTAFLECWLLNPDIGVGEYAERVLVKLLDADRPQPASAAVNGVNGVSGVSPGQLWEYMLTDSVYVQMILAYCRDADGEVDEQPDEDGHVKTAPLRSTAQSRILSILPALACLSFRIVAERHADQPALLDFAWSGMVDVRDPLMVRNLHSFYLEIVGRTQCLLAQSDRRTGTGRASRPHMASLEGIADSELRYQAEKMNDLVRLAGQTDPALLLQIRALSTEAAVAAEQGLITREAADDMRQWIGLVLARRENLPLR